MLSRDRQRFEKRTGKLPPITPSPPPKTGVTIGYHGTLLLDPQRVNREMATIVEEIIPRLSSLTGTDVDGRAEISAERPSRFDHSTVRDIRETTYLPFAQEVLALRMYTT